MEKNFHWEKQWSTHSISILFKQNTLGPFGPGPEVDMTSQRAPGSTRSWSWTWLKILLDRLKLGLNTAKLAKRPQHVKSNITINSSASPTHQNTGHSWQINF